MPRPFALWKSAGLLFESDDQMAALPNTRPMGEVVSEKSEEGSNGGSIGSQIAVGLAGRWLFGLVEGRIMRREVLARGESGVSGFGWWGGGVCRFNGAGMCVGGRGVLQ